MKDGVDVSSPPTDGREVASRRDQRRGGDLLVVLGD
jgi:hypothetical protein